MDGEGYRAGTYDYCVQTKKCGQVGVDKAMQITAPDSTAWDLVSVVYVANSFIYYWKRWRTSQTDGLTEFIESKIGKTEG